MPSVHELERTSSTELAAKCQRVADNPGAYLQEAADEASKLKLEWDTLQTYPNPNYAVQKKIEQQKDHLAKRMIEFLTRIL
jgi:primase-polymerase (primpol)-like protein